ncbi:MAG: hypothetical protein ACX931_12380 [Saccharospirillum sp.]
MKHWIGIALMSWPWLAWGQDSTDFEATAEAATQSEACERAFAHTEADALAAQGGEVASDAIVLLARTDERLGRNADGAFECRVSSRWEPIGGAEADRASAQPNSAREDLLGSEQRIRGLYQATCRTERLCQEQIERDAADDLQQRLTEEYGIRRGDYFLEADGFEGTQRVRQGNGDVQLSMDGTFYFRVREAGRVRAEPATPARTEAEIRIERRPERRERSLIDGFDLTLAHTWDINNGAQPDQLALSAERWELGIWANNRVGASVLWGNERAGIANDSERVFNDGERYAIRGAGFGFRLFDTRSLTVENMLHYVDTRTYRTMLEPGCTGCTPREYEAEDYLQATVKVKTNTKGLNVGWVLTWKLRPDLSNYDSLSGGWYVELQL